MVFFQQWNIKACNEIFSRRHRCLPRQVVLFRAASGKKLPIPNQIRHCKQSLEKFPIIYSLILTSTSRIKDLVPRGYMDMDTENLRLIPTSEYIPHPNATFANMPADDWADIQRDFATVFEGRRTNVQVKKLCNSRLNYCPTSSSSWCLRWEGWESGTPPSHAGRWRVQNSPSMFWKILI